MCDLLSLPQPCANFRRGGKVPVLPPKFGGGGSPSGENIALSSGG